MKSIQRISVIVAVLSLVLSGTAFANESADMAVVIPGSAAMQWAPAVPYESMSLRVSGPDVSMEYFFGPSELPVFSVFDEFGNVYPDGTYSWEFRLSPVLPEGVKRALADSRERGNDGEVARQLKRSGLVPAEEFLVQSGSFTIAGGSIVDGSLVEEARRGAPISVDAPARSGDGPTPMSAADQVFLDDVIVDGSLCAGLDCVNGENFGFDTIRMKENNLRLHFDDTSATASFPSNDWRLTANESDNGGANKFSIDDATAGRSPFTIEAGANANTLYVEADGDVGIKTANPVVDIHIVEGNTPTLRLEQDGSDGFTPQIYDIAANEANFFIRDVTNGSRLFFRSKPGAPEDSIFIAADGDVGLGTDNPTDGADLDVVGNASVGVFQVRTSDSGTRVSMAAAGTAGFVGTQSDDPLVFNTNTAERMRILSTGQVSIGCFSSLGSNDFVVSGTQDAVTDCSSAPASTLQAGATTFTASSSRLYKTNLQPIPAQGILDKIAAIDVYNYDFIDGPEDVIGLVAEDFHQVFGKGSDKMLNGQEVQMALWLAVQELSASNAELKREIEALKAASAAP
ncbi:MAG: tail fiber domain-containing protein [Acidobacteriota bacterium]